MSIVVAARSDKEVWIGCDSQATEENDLATSLEEPKFCFWASTAVGWALSIRAQRVLELTARCFPDGLHDRETVYAFVEQFRGTAWELQLPTAPVNSGATHAVNLLVAAPEFLAVVFADYSVVWNERFAVIGAPIAAAGAYGVHSTQGAAWRPKDLVRQALAAAVAHSSNCGAPCYMLRVHPQPLLFRLDTTTSSFQQRDVPLALLALSIATLRETEVTEIEGKEQEHGVHHNEGGNG